MGIPSLHLHAKDRDSLTHTACGEQLQVASLPRFKQKQLFTYESEEVTSKV